MELIKEMRQQELDNIIMKRSNKNFDAFKEIFIKGFWSFFDGKSIDFNPYKESDIDKYPFGTNEDEKHYFWYSGWLNAREIK